MKILYVEDELSKNIPRIIRLFSKFLDDKSIQVLQEIEADNYGVEPKAIKEIIETSSFVEIDYCFPDALKKVIQHPEHYALFLVDRNLEESEYSFEEVAKIDVKYNETQHQRFRKREGDYLLQKLVFTGIDVLSKFYFLTAYPNSDQIRESHEIETLLNFGQFNSENFIEKGNSHDFERLQQIIATANLSDIGYEALIRQGESNTLEFKSTLRYCLKQKSPQLYIEHAVMKTIAAYLNSDGGTLLIGVDDDGRILGLEDDFLTFKAENKSDAFLRYFDNLIAENFGDRFHRHFKVRFAMVDGKKICVVIVKQKAAEDVWLKNKEKSSEQFYIRRAASTIELSPREAAKYIKEHWK